MSELNNNLTFLNNKEIIKKINKFSGLVILLGFSQTTKEQLNKITKTNNIIIIDNNKKLHNTKYKNIKILSPKNLKKLDKKYIVTVWGNYCKENIKQLKELNIRNILIDLDNGGYQVNSSSFVIETPPYSIEKNTALGAQHKFIFNFMRQLTLMKIQFKTKPINQINIDKKYNTKSNQIVISYHTKGDTQTNLFRYKESYLPDYVTFDSMGFSGWHSLCKNKNILDEISKIDIKKAVKFHNKLYTKYVLNNKSKYKQNNIVDDKLPKKYVFFPLQVSTDIVSQLAYHKQEDIIKKLITVYTNTDIQVVIKKHPKCTDINLNKLLKKLEKDNRILLFNGSIHQAIKNSILVFTVNSGVGFEALIHLKPVITFGKSDYMTMTKNINDLKEVKSSFNYHLSQNDQNRIKQFLYYYLKYNCIKINSINQILKLTKYNIL